MGWDASPGTARRDALTSWWVLAAGAAATLILHGLAVDTVATPSAELRVAFETAIMLTALLAAFLVIGRLRLVQAQDDAWLVAGLVVFAVVSVLVWTLPLAVLSDGTRSDAVWALAGLRLTGAAFLACAAWSPARTRAWRAIGLIWSFSAAVVVANLLLIPAAIRLSWLPPVSVVVEREVVQTAAGGERALEALGFIVLLAAAVGFRRRHRPMADPFIRWVILFVYASAISRLNHVVTPTFYLERFHLGDLVRLVAYALLLAGALLEIEQTWRRHAAATVVAERRRIARELHDGVAQEAVYIANAARDLEREHPHPVLADVVTAADRVIEEARRAITTLSQAPDGSVGRVIEDVAEQVTAREGVRLRASCAEDVTVGHEATEMLARIVREAITNAVRHGGADVIDLELRADGPIRMTVRDDGCGFDTTVRHRSGHHGLIIMEERAAELGATLSICSGPGRGTCVEVTL